MPFYGDFADYSFVDDGIIDGAPSLTSSGRLRHNSHTVAVLPEAGHDAKADYEHHVTVSLLSKLALTQMEDMVTIMLSLPSALSKLTWRLTPTLLMSSATYGNIVGAIVI